MRLATALLAAALGFAEEDRRPPMNQAPDPAGILVMAHGGEEAWNQAVRASLKGLEAAVPVELALGMADADTLQAAILRLEAKGVRRIAVIRLFISGESFLGRTRKILGLDPGAPARAEWASAAAASGDGHDHHAHGHDPDKMPLWRVDTRSRIHLRAEGLLDGDVAGKILAERAKALSQSPKTETVLLLGHGPGDDAENARWLAAMDRAAAEVKRARKFKAVRVETLREDWPERRREAVARIRKLAAATAKAGGRFLVVPARVHGFGPYAGVLKNLPYVSDGKGLLPHPLVGEWLKRQAAEAFKAAGWSDAAAPLN